MIKQLIFIVLMVINLIFLSATGMPLAILKLLLPGAAGQRWINGAIEWLGYRYCAFNNAIYRLLSITEWQFIGLDQLSDDKNYLVVSNHQAQTDILVALQAFHAIRRLPILRFFLKSQLKWVPLINIIAWMYDMPFMNRYSRAYLEKHPEKRGKDFETAKQACDKLRGQRFTFINYVEGTRQTSAKKAKQNSPYRHLLKPKAGGIAQIIHAVGDELDGVIDLTIIYPGKRSLFDFAAGRINKIIVDVQVRPIPDYFLEHNYSTDDDFKHEFHTWLNQIWDDKDALLATYLDGEAV